MKRLVEDTDSWGGRFKPLCQASLVISLGFDFMTPPPGESNSIYIHYGSPWAPRKTLWSTIWTLALRNVGISNFSILFHLHLHPHKISTNFPRSLLSHVVSCLIVLILTVVPVVWVVPVVPPGSVSSNSSSPRAAFHLAASSAKKDTA